MTVPLLLKHNAYLSIDGGNKKTAPGLSPMPLYKHPLAD
jgi:hypothetical protein